MTERPPHDDPFANHDPHREADIDFWQRKYRKYQPAILVAPIITFFLGAAVDHVKYPRIETVEVPVERIKEVPRIETVEVPVERIIIKEVPREVIQHDVLIIDDPANIDDQLLHEPCAPSRTIYVRNVKYAHGLLLPECRIFIHLLKGQLLVAYYDTKLTKSAHIDLQGQGTWSRPPAISHIYVYANPSNGDPSNGDTDFNINIQP